MKKRLISGMLLAGAMLAGSIGAAQTTVGVDINKAKLAWSYNTADEALITQFIAKCGTATGSYSKLTNVADPKARSLPVINAISGPGTWFCVVTAANADVESAPTNEVSFKAFTPPPAPVGLGVLAQ